MVAILKYNAGNIQSVQFALQRLGVDFILTDDPEALKKADRVIFPGVGEASSTMAHLREKGLDETIRALTQPVLGICLGMQLLCAHSEEGNTDALNVFPLEVRKFKLSDPQWKVPHTGWNSLVDLKGPLFQGIDEKAYCYFVHSYYVEQGDFSIACANHGHKFSAAIYHKNFWAVQFHPEKSGATGLKILKNFLECT